MPKVTLIVPVYNVEPYLKRCLNSLINQTYKDYEIICINDCSPGQGLHHFGTLLFSKFLPMVLQKNGKVNDKNSKKVAKHRNAGYNETNCIS